MPSVGLSMIVKNGADTLRPCLESVCGVVEQIVIADTGSTDNTCEIAREFNATIISVPWEKDFAKARNAALERVQTDWVLVLDADEELDREGGRNIPQLLQAEDVGGYVTRIRNYVGARFSRGWDRTSVPNDGRHPRANNAPAYFIHENCRFFRRHPKIYFTGRVHELVENQVLALGLKLESANFFIHHFGQLAEAQVKDSKAVLYRELLRLRVQEHPDDPLGWVHLGLQEYEYHNNPLEGLRCFERCLALEPRAAEAWVFTGMIFIDLGKYEEALRAFEQDRRAGKVTAFREQLKGDALHSLGRWQEARLAYRRALKWAGANDPLLESKLGYTQVKAGQNHAGLARLRRAARAVPGMFAIHDRLMKACIIADRLEEAAEVAEGLAQALPNPKSYLRAASIRAKLQQWEESTAILSRGLLLFPQSRQLQDAHDEAETMRRRKNGQLAGGAQANQHHENRVRGGIGCFPE
jgi:glycosyltransferase involved in cell wall biosynthesis